MQIDSLSAMHIFATAYEVKQILIGLRLLLLSHFSPPLPSLSKDYSYA